MRSFRSITLFVIFFLYQLDTWTNFFFLGRLGFVEGVWIVGVVDEIRMHVTETENNPTFVDTKTRQQATLPAEPQRRNGRYAHSCNFCFDVVDKRLFLDACFGASGSKS